MTEQPDWWTPAHEAAALHGVATDEGYPPHHRLAAALQALTWYETDRAKTQIAAEGYVVSDDDYRAVHIKHSCGSDPALPYEVPLPDLLKLVAEHNAAGCGAAPPVTS